MFDHKVSRRQFLRRSVAGGALAGMDLKLATGDEVRDAARASELTLQAGGDPQQGYFVTILLRNQPVTHSQNSGEFSAFFQNAERSLEDRIAQWKAASWGGDPSHLTLRGECRLPDLNVTVAVEVDYDVVARGVVRKRLRFRQADIYRLFWQVSNEFEPAEPPAKFWSFNQADCSGGALHEYFPAAGFRTTQGLTVGLLTDAGFRNHWTRLIRRDGKPVKPAPQRIPDVNLLYIPRAEERAKGKVYVRQTFGESLVWSKESPDEAVALPPLVAWKRRGLAEVQERDGAVVLTALDSADGVFMPFAAQDGEVYSIRFRYRAQSPFAVELMEADQSPAPGETFTLYNDRVPESPGKWGEFQTTVFVHSLRRRDAMLAISLPQSEQAIALDTKNGPVKIEIRDFALGRVKTRSEPYDQLRMDNVCEKTSFIYFDEQTPDTLRGYRLASQLHLAEASGFRGGETEKVLYADLSMLSWIAGPECFAPMVAPSIWYSAAGEMYLRDSFFAANGVYNPELNEGVFNLWAANQGPDGAINTLVEPNRANLERKSNDSTPLWLIWALQNRRRFGTTLPMDKIRKAAEYCLRTYDRNHDGNCWAQFVIGQLDVVDFPAGVTDVCENQGMLAVTLRVIKALEIPEVSARVSEEYIQKVEEGYRSYYDRVRKRLRPARQITNAVGFDEIFPEFLSLWLFNHKILTDEMMCNHLDSIPALMPHPDAPHPEVAGTVRPIFIGLKEDGTGWSYFTDTWHPLISREHGANYADHQMDGIYYNGGSWMRIEVCGYVAGKLHGWPKAEKAIANRLWAELHLAPDFPTSQEYLATDSRHPFFGYHRVFAWNAFVLQALELAGLRRPGMDPDFRSPL